MLKISAANTSLLAFVCTGFLLSFCSYFVVVICYLRVPICLILLCLLPLLSSFLFGLMLLTFCLPWFVTSINSFLFSLVVFRYPFPQLHYFFYFHDYPHLFKQCCHPLSFFSCLLDSLHYPLLVWLYSLDFYASAFRSTMQLYIILHDVIVLFVKEAPTCCQLEGIINTCTYIHACCTKLQQRLGICKIRIIRMKSFTAVCGSEMVKAFFSFLWTDCC